MQNLGPSTLHDFKIKFLIPQKLYNHKENILEISKTDVSLLFYLRTLIIYICMYVYAYRRL